MRRGHGSTKVPNVKLRPAKKSANQVQDTDHDATLYGTANASARETLRNDKKPFSGMTVCCSGVRDKAGLLAKARELGATCSSDLTDLTTHLVADVPGSAKYKCAFELGIPVCTSDWIIETHTRWLAGDDIDPEECVGEHLLPPLRGVVVCVTQLDDEDARKRITKSAMRLGAKYQAHMDKGATHLLIGPDDGATVDSQKLQWVLRTNAKRIEQQTEEPPIFVVWDTWLLTCAATNSRVPEVDFAYSETGTRPELPEDLERLLRRTSSKKPAKVYVTASNVGASTSTRTKEVLEKARVRKVAPTGAAWNMILSSRNQASPEEDRVPPTFAQAPRVSPPTSSPIMPPKSTPPPPAEDSATEDEEQSIDRNAAISGGHTTQKPPIPTPEQLIPPKPRVPPKIQSGAAGSSMVSRLNSLRGSAFQLGAPVSDQNLPIPSARPLARTTSTHFGQKPGASDVLDHQDGLASSLPNAKVFTGKRIAPIGEARTAALYAALRAHGAVVIEHPEGFDLKGKGKMVEPGRSISLPQENADYYIVRLASESAKQASKLDSYPKFRTDCWVEHCIFEDRLCSPEENITYTPLKIQLPVPGAGDIKLHFTGLNNEQETTTKRLTKAIGMVTTESFAKRVNTHLLCPSRSGLKYDKALQWKVTVVDMDWLYTIAKEGRIPDQDIIRVEQKLEQSSSRGGATTTDGPSRLGVTDPHPTAPEITSVGATSLFGTPNGLLDHREQIIHPGPLPSHLPKDRNISGVTPNGAFEIERKRASPMPGTRPEGQRSVSNGEASREAQNNQLANNLNAILKRHRREESINSDQPWKRMRPAMRQKAGEGTPGNMIYSHLLSEQVSSMSLSAQGSGLDYVSPLEGLEPANEETLQVHYHDPNQHAAKEGLRRLLDGSSQVDPDIIPVDTQTEPEESQEASPIEAKRKRGGAVGGRRKSHRKT